MQDKSFGQRVFNVLVYGWYNHHNIGDDLFCEAFKTIFPNINFSFSDNITVDKIKDASAIFVGGGSFLSENTNVSQECLNIIKTKKIFYIGVGAETDIHPSHKELIRMAKLIALRSPAGIEKITELNDNVIIIPDIVYSLKSDHVELKKPKSVLVLPNIHAVPQNTDAHWKHSSWERFKFEFSQFLDYIIEDGYSVNFFSMCNNNKHNDDWAAYEIISNMKHRDGSRLVKPESSNIKDVCKLFSKYENIITQRFHGIILSEIIGLPCLTIAHHDKLNYPFGKNISFYGTFKNKLIELFYQPNLLSTSNDEKSFLILQDMINNIL